MISSLSVKAVQSSRHFHRAHFVLLNSHSKPALYDLFYSSLHQAFPEIPLIPAGEDGELLLIPITIDYETVFITIRSKYTQGERINYFAFHGAKGHGRVPKASDARVLPLLAVSR